MKSHSNHACRRSLALIVALTIVAVSTPSVALGAPTAWSVPAGNQTNFTYSNGQTQNNHFGDGTAYLSGDGFFFSPQTLVATADNNFQSIGMNQHSASDTLSVILNAKPTQQFSSISTAFLGDFSTNGFASVGASGQLRIFNLDDLTALPKMMAVDFGPNPFGTVGFALGDSSGVLDGLATIALPNGWANVRVEVDGMVSADALFGSSIVQFKDVSLDVATSEFHDPDNITNIPIPAAFAVAPLGAAVAYRARRMFGGGRRSA